MSVGSEDIVKFLAVEVWPFLKWILTACAVGTGVVFGFQRSIIIELREENKTLRKEIHDLDNEFRVLLKENSEIKKRIKTIEIMTEETKKIPRTKESEV